MKLVKRTRHPSEGGLPFAATDAALRAQLGSLSKLYTGVQVDVGDCDYDVAVRVQLEDPQLPAPENGLMPTFGVLIVSALKAGIPVGHARLRAEPGECIATLVIEHDLIRLAMHDADCKKVGSGYMPFERIQGSFYDR